MLVTMEPGLFFFIPSVKLTAVLDKQNMYFQNGDLLL